MPRTCTICTHPEREAIDRALSPRVDSYRHIASQFDVSTAAVRRHEAEHLPESLAMAQEAREVAHGDDLLAQVVDLQQRTLAILTQAEKKGDGRLALSAIAEARRNLELLGKLAGELQQEGTVNLILTPQWIELQTVILQALAPYPEARLAVAEAVGDR